MAREYAIGLDERAQITVIFLECSEYIFGGFEVPGLSDSTVSRKGRS